jgi:hypothetical protein
MLAIDIPKNNEQSPKALEQFFDHLYGIQTTPKWEDKWLKGRLQESFSLEIISLGGYIQFLIQTPAQYRDLVEAAIYAQYPDAEIIEVEDYVQRFKDLKFPNDEYNLWGAELRLTKKEFYPIKTYVEFEHSLSQELKDPMAALLEILSKLGPDEQAWLQIVITPAPDSWRKEGEILAKKLIGAEVKEKKGLIDYLWELPIKLITRLGDIVNGILLGQQEQPAPQKEQPPSLMQYLSPGEKATVEAIERKISKTGFYSRIRFIYLAKQQAFNPAPRVDGVMGAMNQFSALNLNGFAPHKKKKTKVYGPFKQMRLNWRRNNILRLYRLRARNYRPGYYGYILNTEELATLYHFPILTVKAPLVKKTETKRAEPPISLPIESPTAIPHAKPVKDITK